MSKIRRRRRLLASQLRHLQGAAPDEYSRSHIRSVQRESARLRARFNAAKKRKERRESLVPVLS